MLQDHALFAFVELANVGDLRMRTHEEIEVMCNAMNRMNCEI